MSGKNNIFLNHTLDEYNAKYRNRRHKLLVYTEDEINGYDKKYKSFKADDGNVYKIDPLKNRKWWKIENKYYEIPKFPRWTWFRNLKKSAQVATWVVLGVGILIGVTATGVTHYIAYGDYTVVQLVDEVTEHLRFESRKVFGGLSITLIPKNPSVSVIAINNITIGNDNVLLKQGLEYTFDLENSKVYIIEPALKAHKGVVTINPDLEGIN